MKEEKKYKSVIFLDFDGVFNCQTFYDDPLEFHPENIDDEPYSHTLWNCSKKRMEWFNQLCKDTGSVVVISASLRNSFDIEQLRDLFARMGGTLRDNAEKVVDEYLKSRESHDNIR